MYRDVGSYVGIEVFSMDLINHTIGVVIQEMLPGAILGDHVTVMKFIEQCL